MTGTEQWEANSHAKLIEGFLQDCELRRLSTGTIEGYKSNRITFQESGTFTRKIVRHKGKSRTKTDREYNKNNPEKVVLGYLGNIEFFCYPFSSQDVVYSRIGKDITGLDKYQIKKGIAIYNILRWATDGGMKKAIAGESNAKKADEIKEAYNSGFKSMLNKQKDAKPVKSFAEKLKEMKERQRKKQEKELEEMKERQRKKQEKENNKKG